MKDKDQHYAGLKSPSRKNGKNKGQALDALTPQKLTAISFKTMQPQKKIVQTLN
jgi:hypothetical protein